jgi:hypothetical protein
MRHGFASRGLFASNRHRDRDLADRSHHFDIVPIGARPACAANVSGFHRHFKGLRDPPRHGRGLARSMR